MTSGITLEHVRWPTSHWEKIISLHRANARRLGFFPKGAFEQHAKLKQIIVALDRDGNCLDYLLYRLARDRASITHLCVDESARRFGVSRRLVDQLKKETKSRQGIGLYCRSDWEAAEIWPKFGFEAVNSKVGRGKDGAELIFWWFSHGHRDLFSSTSEPDPVRQRVVIDANVFYDLHFRDTFESEDSKALLADWVQSSIELVITKELSNEITNAPSGDQRKASRAKTTLYKQLPVDDSAFQQICSELRTHFPETPTDRDKADQRQVAYAIAGGAQFMVTRDRTLIERCDPLYQSHGLTVLQPAELINHLDSVERENDYRPARIEGSRLKNAKLKGAAIDAAVTAFKLPTERSGEFRQILHHCLSQPRTVDVQLISDYADAYVLLGVTDRSESKTVDVPVLRLRKHPLATTMFRNFIRSCLAASAAEGRSVVSVSEPNLSKLERGILSEFGFVDCGNALVKLTLQVIGSLEDLRDAVDKLPLTPAWQQAKEHSVTALTAARDLQAASEIVAVERHLWPAKIVHTEIPTFIVSIQPKWAQHFFDVDLGSQMLFGLRDDLHLGVEGVYFRKAKNNNLVPPGRILWYVSQGDREGSMSVKACSHLEEVVVGYPKDLFRRFQRLGVFQWSDILGVAGGKLDSDIVAFRFRMTERFKHPVGADDLKKFQIRFPLMTSRKISSSQFALIYKKGFALT